MHMLSIRMPHILMYLSVVPLFQRQLEMFSVMLDAIQSASEEIKQCL